MAKHPRNEQHEDEQEGQPAQAGPGGHVLPTGSILEAIVDRLTVLVGELEHAANNNAPVSVHFIREVSDIRDALK